MTESNGGRSAALGQLARLFFKLGSISFGGPAAHLAMMEDEVVNRRHWISHEHFLDLIGATNLIPGPNSTEMAIHIGYVRGGWRGLIVAGICFIFPAIAITLTLAYLYVAYGSLPLFQPFFSGIRPAIIAVILAAVFRLSRSVVKNPLMAALGVLVLILNLVGFDEILLLLVSGAVGLLWNNRRRLRRASSSRFSIFPLLSVQAFATSISAQSIGGSPTIMGLGLFFLKIGSILYGSGYVLAAFLQAGLVETKHWLTQSQLVDAIAVGQFTPGPVLSTATFVGYLILGIPGATIATTGIFLPSFVFVLILSPFIPKLRTSQVARGFLDGVNAASLALMTAVTIKLAALALSGIASSIIVFLAAVALIAWNTNPAWIVLGSAILGWLLST
jgi:chromate transporter